MKKLVVIFIILNLFTACEMDEKSNLSTNTSSTYTIIYNANGGNGEMENSTHVYGTAKNLNANTFTYDTYIFLGWSETSEGQIKYTDQQSVIDLTDENGATITLYAVWHPTIVPGLNLADKLAWLQVNSLNGIDYTVEVNTNEIIDPAILSGNNIGITIKSTGIVCTIELSSSGSLFTVYGGITLTLDNNITLQGRNNNIASLIQVNRNGTLVMNTGSRIIGNSIPYDENNSPFPGGGVHVWDGGNFIMIGGEISNNSATSGGGVYVNGNFTMKGGEISNNNVYGIIAPSAGVSYPTYGIGGGVYVDENASFIMENGKILDNISYGKDGGGGCGGGVALNGTFSMTGGEIFNNTASWTDGYPTSMYGSWVYGGGVYVNNSGNKTASFTMTDGKIYGNTVYLSGSAMGYGGGVFVARGIFIKTNGGTIYGYNENNTINSNNVMYQLQVQIDRGNAVYATWNSIKRKETTAGFGVNLSWDFNDYSPVWSGDWDY